MATSKVLLVKPVEKLGGEGEQVTVKAGYARNFLLPKKIAIPVTKANKKQIALIIFPKALLKHYLMQFIITVIIISISSGFDSAIIIVSATKV